MNENSKASMPLEGSQHVISELGELKPHSLITKAGLAAMFNRCEKSIERAVGRGELPPPVRLMGKSRWTVDALRKHMSARLDEARRKAEKESEELSTRVRELEP